MASKKDGSAYFLVHYRDPKDGKIVAIKARRIEDSTLGLGFVRISDFLFDTSGVVVQPTEVQLEQHFKNVRSLHLSIYSIVSVEEIGQKHAGLKFKKAKSNLISFPGDSSTNPKGP
jgi:hypothetical protein